MTARLNDEAIRLSGGGDQRGILANKPREDPLIAERLEAAISSGKTDFHSRGSPPFVRSEEGKQGQLRWG